VIPADMIKLKWILVNHYESTLTKSDAFSATFGF